MTSHSKYCDLNMSNQGEQLVMTPTGFTLITQRYGWWRIDVWFFLLIALVLLWLAYKVFATVLGNSPIGTIPPSGWALCAIFLGPPAALTYLIVRLSRWRAVFILDHGILVTHQVGIWLPTQHAWPAQDIGEVYASWGNHPAGRERERKYRLRFVNQRKELLGDVLKGRPKAELEHLAQKIREALQLSTTK